MTILLYTIKSSLTLSYIHTVQLLLCTFSIVERSLSYNLKLHLIQNRLKVVQNMTTNYMALKSVTGAVISGGITPTLTAVAAPIVMIS